MASEARLAANRRNAQKSTGPKTEAGKEKSKRNALKHGLSGKGIVLRRRDARKVVKRISDWRAVLCPINPLEDTLVERAALAAVRCESAVKQEAVERSRRVTKALSRIEVKKRKEIAAILELLKTEPGRAERELEERKRGVSWLIVEWKSLADRLRSRGHLCCTEAALMLRLLGLEPEMPYPDDAEVLAIRKAFVGSLPELDLEAAEALLGLSADGQDDSAREAAVSALLPDPAEARSRLQAIISTELSRLEERLAELATDRTERLERAEAIRRAQVGLDTRSVGLHRYERDEEMSLHRNLNELIRIRKQEPDVASVARWEKMGKKFQRRWDGYQWAPNPEWSPTASERDDGSGGSDAGVAGGAWRVAREDKSVVGEGCAGGTGDSGLGVGEEPKTMTDGGWQMTEQTADSGSDLVSHPSSVISHSPSTPVSHQPSVISHPGASPAVWPGLSAACPGVLPNNPGLEEASGLPADEPVTATEGSLRSTPATRSGSHPEEGKSGLVADDHERVTGASLRSDPGTRSEADERPDSLQPQARTRVAGFSAWREPGASEPKQEPAEKAMTDGKWLMTEQTPDPAPLSHLPQPLSHPSSAISHSSPTPLSHPPSVISHSSPSPFSHQPSAIRHPLPQPPTPNPQPLLAKAHLPADRSLPPATLPPNEPNPVDATNGAASGWNEAGAADRSGLDEALKRASQAWPSPVVFDPVW